MQPTHYSPPTTHHPPSTHLPTPTRSFRRLLVRYVIQQSSSSALPQEGRQRHWEGKGTGSFYTIANMASSSSAFPQASQDSAIADLNDEIQFQIAMLLSMDDTVRDRAEMEREAHLEIVNLQQQVRELGGKPYDLPPGLALPPISQSSKRGSASSASSSNSVPHTGSMVATPATLNGYQCKSCLPLHIPIHPAIANTPFD